MNFFKNLKITSISKYFPTLLTHIGFLSVINYCRSFKHSGISESFPILLVAIEFFTSVNSFISVKLLGTSKDLSHCFQSQGFFQVEFFHVLEGV